MRVQAAPLEHSVPCVGYVVTEKTRAGRLKIEDVLGVVNRNRAALTKTFKISDPNKIFAVLKDMKRGMCVIILNIFFFI